MKQLVSYPQIDFFYFYFTETRFTKRLNLYIESNILNLFYQKKIGKLRPLLQN